jgi:thiol-disulfide isomerase/thioredoxin
MRTRLAAITAAQFLLFSWAPGAAHAEFGFDQYEGKVVVLDFWASWCVPCRRSFPWLNAMQEKYADEGLAIVGVNLDMERADAEQFLREYPAMFTILYDEHQQLARQFEVVAMPSSYVIGRNGEVIARHMGFKVKEQDDYESVIVDALREPGDEDE